MSAYKIISVVGSSGKSWEDAAGEAIKAATKSLRNLRIATVKEMDVSLDEKGKVRAYRVRLDLSFKYEV
jgi:dodecin